MAEMLGCKCHIRLCVKREFGAKIGSFREAATMAGKKRRRPSGLRPYLLAVGEPPWSRETTATQTVWGRAWGKSKKASNPLPPQRGRTERVGSRLLSRKQVQNSGGGVPEVHHKKVPSSPPPSGGPGSPTPSRYLTLPFCLSRATNALCAPQPLPMALPSHHETIGKAGNQRCFTGTRLGPLG